MEIILDIFGKIEDCWFEVAVVRASAHKSFSGGLSAFWKFLMVEAFFNPSAHDGSLAGILLQLPHGCHRHLYIDLDSVIADEAALHYLFGCKGSSGLRPCMKCANIFNYQHKARRLVEDDRTGVKRYHCTHDFDALVLHTQESLTSIMTKLEDSKRAAAPNFDELEIMLGWSYIPGGAMFCPEFRRRIACKEVFDGMHILFVNGVFNKTAGLLVKAMKGSGIAMDQLYTYFKAWKHPAAHGAGVAEVFAPDRINNSLAAVALKCSASEALGVFPILAQFCCSKLEHRVAPHCRVFLKLGRVIGLWLRAVRRVSSAQDLRDATVEFLLAFAELYGYDSMTMLKFHYLMHLVTQFERQLSCWTHERKHKFIKKWANEMKHAKKSPTSPSTHWDRFVHREVTVEHLHRIQSLTPDHFSDKALLDGYVSTPKIAMGRLLQDIFPGPTSFKVSRTVKVDAYRERCSVSGIVMLRNGNIGKLLWNVAVSVQGGDPPNTVVFVCLKMHSLQSAHERVLKFLCAEELRVVEACKVLCSLIYAGNDGEMMTALRPLHCLKYRQI